MRASRGRPARSACTAQRQPGNSSATAAGTASPWSKPISSRAIPSLSSTFGSRSSSRRISSSPSGPPSSARRGSNERSLASPSSAPVATYGRFAQITA